jgi:general secretion pathway protein F
MPSFRYRAFTPSGEVVLGTVDAPTRDEVIRRIEYLGFIPADAEPEAKTILERSGLSTPKLPRGRDVTMFLRQLALLVGAGLTLEAALQTLAEDAGKPLASFVNGLRSGISAGQSFTEVLERYPELIEPAYVAMIRAGEASGRLERVLGAIVADRTRREALAERFSQSLRYPIFLIVAAIAICCSSSCWSCRSSSPCSGISAAS